MTSTVAMEWELLLDEYLNDCPTEKHSKAKLSPSYSAWRTFFSWGGTEKVIRSLKARNGHLDKPWV